MNADDTTEYGYDPDVDRDADPTDPVVGDVPERSWRRLGHELTHARSVADLVRTIERYGWAPPFLGLFLLGGVRGVFEYLSEPFAMSQGYVFTGWQVALAINLLYGVFFVAFSWFMYYGVIGGLAGYFSDETDMNATMFKVGGYFSVLFVPLVVVGSAVALTIPSPDAAVAGVDSATAVAETHQAVEDSPQMRLFGLLMAGGWILVGFLMLPVVAELYDIEKRESVFAVLPVTLVAVVATQLL